MEVEHPFIRAPFEAFSKFVRNSQKLMEKEASHTFNEARKLSAKHRVAPGHEKDALKAVVALKAKVETAKKKLMEGEKQAVKYLDRMRVRLQHLRFVESAGASSGNFTTAGGMYIGNSRHRPHHGHHPHHHHHPDGRTYAPTRSAIVPSSSSASAQISDANALTCGVEHDLSSGRVTVERVRTDRLLADYLLRRGYYESASAVATDAKIKELVDLEIFMSAKNVIDALQARDCSKALLWCTANKSKLQRVRR